MNNISWLIYWADALPQLATALCVASALLFLFLGFLFILGYTNQFGDGFRDEAIGVRFRNIGWVLPVLFVYWLLSFAVPSDRNTYYAIAASELGEQAINTPTAGKATKALDAWLDKQIAPPKKDDDEE